MRMDLRELTWRQGVGWGFAVIVLTKDKETELVSVTMKRRESRFIGMTIRNQLTVHRSNRMTERERERLEGGMRGLVCTVTRKKMVPERWPRLSVEDKTGEVRLRTRSCRRQGKKGEDSI